jgi:hypothetical protein
MPANDSIYDVICLLCGFQTGRLAANRYRPNGDCAPAVGVTDVRKLRCCRCGGSVYLEAGEAQSPYAALLEAQRRASA